MSLDLSTSIDIQADPDAVWAVLSDLPAYRDWNPFIREASGRPVTGERLEIRLSPDGKGSMRFKPVVQAAVAGRELRWLGRLGLPGIFDGEHRFRIEPTATGSRLLQEEHFSGVLVPFMAKRLRRDYVPAFERMNAALKEQVEARA